MKPKDLKRPFSWDERKVLLNDRVLYVPDYYDQYDTFKFPGWEDEQIFGNTNPVYVEYCSGNGTWIAKKAQEEPSCNWVAIEMKFERVRKIWSKIKNLKLDNLFIICGEGLTITSRYFDDEAVDKVFVNFPDPWPKKRHAKHRIIQPPFTNEVNRILKDKGEFTVVTDDPTYSEQICEVLQGSSNYKSIYPSPHYATELEGYGTSFFDQLWREKGKTIRYHQYLKECR